MKAIKQNNGMLAGVEHATTDSLHRAYDSHIDSSPKSLENILPLRRIAKGLAVDRDQALQFLKMFSGLHTFQTFDDDSKCKRPVFSSISHRLCETVLDKLCQYNDKGAGVFLLINEGDGRGRKRDNIHKVRAVFVDLDGAPIEPVIAAGLEPHIIVESSPGKYHAYWLVHDCSLDEFGALQKGLAAKFDGDSSVHDLPRVMRIPGFYHRKGESFLSRILKINPDLPQYSITDIRIITANVIKPMRNQKKVMIVPEGGRNNHLAQLGMSLVRGKVPSERVLEQLLSENLHNCKPSLDESEVRAIWLSIEKYRGDESQIKSYTDQAVAETLIAKFMNKICYNEERKAWLVYDGNRWDFNAPGGIRPLLRDTIEQLYISAAKLDPESRLAAIKRLKPLESSLTQRNILEMTSTYPEVIVRSGALDSDLYLLNLANGTLNLKTGKLHDHRPADYITKKCPVNFDPSAKCPMWLTFLDKIMGGNQEMVRFLQIAIGYSLTGDISEQCFFVCNGIGANGKTTMMNTIKSLMGDYGTQADPRVLMVREKENGGPTPELARLAGARFVATSEAEDGQRFAEAQIKLMTGSDPITARFLHRNQFEFVPQYTIWFSTNHKPVVRGNDHGIWRRIHLIPFSVTIPSHEQDKHLERKLRAEFPGILNWALDGCLEWQRNGLRLPEVVSAATQEYRDDMDIFGQWVEACCVLNPEKVTPAKLLYESYKKWAEENAGFAFNPNRFGRTMADRGYIKLKKPDVCWKGIGLRYGFLSNN